MKTIKKIDAAHIEYGDHSKEIAVPANWGVYEGGNLVALIWKNRALWDIVDPKTGKRIVRKSFTSAKSAKQFALSD